MMDDDKKIWNEFRQGENDALALIYNRNVDFLFSYGKKFSKDDSLILDVIHDLFYDLIRRRTSLGETDNIKMYLIKSFRRRIIRKLESIKTKIVQDEDISQIPDIVFSIEEKIIETEFQKQRIDCILKAMEKLSAKQREVLYYKFTCNFEYNQICELMAISYVSARQLVSRSISLIKKYTNLSDTFLFFFLRKDKNC